MPKIRIKVTKNPRLRKAVDLLLLERRDMEKLTKAMGVRFRRHERLLFKTQGSSGGKRWRGLTPAYAKRKRRPHGKPKRRGHRSVMRDTNALYKSLTSPTHPMHIARWKYRRLRSSFIELGTADPKGQWHGDHRNHNPRLPVRDVIQQTNAQRQEYYDILWRYFKRTKVKRYLKALRAGQRAMRQSIR